MEVQDFRPYEDFHEGERIVRTEITLNVLESISGDVPLDELKIRHLGGQIEGPRLEVGTMPKFDVGAEVVLFLHGEGRFICPTVGWGHGMYLIDRKGSDGVARIRRSDGQFLRSLTHVSQPIHSHEDHEIDHPAISPPPAELGMSLSVFVNPFSNKPHVEKSRQ